MKSIIKHIKLYKDSPNAFKRVFYLFFKYLWLTVKLFTNSRFRNEKLTPFIKAPSLYAQQSTYTEQNRYPSLFRLVKSYFYKTGENKTYILSYGCSTGEEVKSLYKYLPNSKITGFDINSWCISQAKKKYKNESFSFFSNYESIKTQKYDAIFALAVLQHSINRKDKNGNARRFLFSDFIKNINLLDELLKPNGLLIIDHSDFKFTDTKISKKYKILDEDENYIKRTRPTFNKDNKRISPTFESYRIFIKR